ncbi:carbohydrate porin [Pseudanabaena sp. FACHB-1998]|uniref:iron uptake porin n=1 Tax=Pseudanabaena sp. FACHB-1998 TaxID=2692858 RepID=UPI0016800343|nr:iron uptake porin [Pseudanabaena sp. FACHB-1998]MBD2178859.1 carbohydrate porin [Pseudanabaena sp. FACHB-1998]
MFLNSIGYSSQELGMNFKIYFVMGAIGFLFNALTDLGNKALALEIDSHTKVTPLSLSSHSIPSESSNHISNYVVTSSYDQQAAQLTSVSQLSDVKATDWTFTALQSLVERYGCIAGYPDRTYRGQQAITRYEFASGLSSCLDKINEIVSAGLADKVRQEDLAALKKLQEEFASELSVLRGRVNTIEVNTSRIESQQFSPITKLNVLSSFNLSSFSSGGDIRAEGVPILGSVPVARFAFRNPLNGSPIVGVVTDKPNTTLSYSNYLILTSSFTGKDTLNLILAMGNGNPPASTFASAGFSSTFAVPYADSNPVVPLPANSVGLFELFYSFPISDNLRLQIGPRILPFRQFDANRFTSILNGAGGLNSYQSSIANSGLTGAGAIIDWKMSSQLTLKAGYLARNDASFLYFGGDASSNPNRGLFGGSNQILTELTYSPNDSTNLRFLYSRTYNQAPPASPLGQPNFPFFLTYSARGVVDDGLGGRLQDSTGDNFVFNFDWLLDKSFGLFGRYSYSNFRILPVNPVISGGNLSLQAFQFGLGFPDLAVEGALGTVSVTIPFQVLSGRNFLVSGNGDGGTQYDVEMTYSYPISEYITLVPSLFAIFNANNFSSNPTIWGAALRTQFLF